MTERRMQAILYRWLLKKNRERILPNVSMYGWEADLISYTKAGYCHELEIKCSRSDFFADAKKRKHMYFDGTLPIEKYGRTERFPNYFWYVCPWDLIQPEEIPGHAGLIWVHPTSYMSETAIVWDAPKLHKHKLTEERKEDLFHIAYWRMWASYEKIAKLEKKLKGATR